jgi:type II secretory pathway pseudopilin PulG
MTSLSTPARAARLGTPRKRGVTLIEAVLYISIALALIVGGLVFFQQASLAQRTNSAVRNISAIASETRGLFQQSQTFAGLTPATLINAGAVPSALIDTTTNPDQLRNEWGGVITIGGSQVVAGFPEPLSSGFVIIYRNVPEAACTRLTATDIGGTGRVGSGIRAISFVKAGGVPQDSDAIAPVDTSTTPVTATLSPSAVAALCRPTGSTGTVDIMWTFNR